MFQKNEMVRARKAFESMYDGTCTITEHQKVKKENKSTGFQDVVVMQDIPCRLSFKTINETSQNENAANSVIQITKIFLAPEIKVNPGSKLTITQHGITTEYKSSGEPAFYSTHQEIVLELFKGWA